MLPCGDALEAAPRSAERNGFDWSSPGYSLTAQPGVIDAAGNFVAALPGTAITLLVEVTSPFHDQFASGTRHVKARAVSGISAPLGSVAVGSQLAGPSGSLGATEVKVLNRLLSRVVSPGTIKVGVVG